MKKQIAKYTYPRSLRLIRSEDYGVLVRVRNEFTFGLGSQYFTASAMWRETENLPNLRLGITVGKRQAPRSVDRQIVKRILREGLRHRAQAYKALLPEAVGIDIVCRLRAPLSQIPHDAKSRKDLKRVLCADLEVLLQRLYKTIKRGPRKPVIGEEDVCG